MYHAERFSRVYLHENDIARASGGAAAVSERFFCRLPKPAGLCPIGEGSRIAELGGGVVLEVAELGGPRPDPWFY